MARTEESIRLGMSTCDHMLEKLEREAARFAAEWHVDHIVNFCITANHLFADWVDCYGDADIQQRRNALPDDAMRVVQAAIDVSKGTKHFELKFAKSNAQRVLDETYTEPINSWHQYFFAPQYNITFDGSTLYFEEFVSIVLGSLTWVIRGPSNAFPQGLCSTT